MTNSYTPEVRDIKVNKVWYDEDNLYQVRAKEVKVNIIADGKVIKTITLNDANNWEETLEDLPVYANGKKIEYKVSEFEVEYYKVIIEKVKKDLQSIIIMMPKVEKNHLRQVKVFH